MSNAGVLGKNVPWLKLNVPRGHFSPVESLGWNVPRQCRGSETEGGHFIPDGGISSQDKMCPGHFSLGRNIRGTFQPLTPAKQCQRCRPSPCYCNNTNCSCSCSDDWRTSTHLNTTQCGRRWGMHGMSVTVEEERVDDVAIRLFWLFGTGQKPMIIAEKSTTNVACPLGHTVILRCYATSSEKMTYSWSKDGKAVNSDYDQSSNDLVVRPRTDEDYGTYKCHVKNRFGHAAQGMLLEQHIKQGIERQWKLSAPSESMGW